MKPPQELGTLVNAKVGLANSVNQKPIFEWYMVRKGSKNGHQKGMCSKHVNYCTFNSQHNWIDLCDHL